MCFPAIGAIASLASGVIGGMAASAQSNANASALKVQAQNTFNQGEFEAQRKQEEIDQVMGRQVASYAGSGVNLTGSAADVIGSTASQGAIDTGAIRWGARANAQVLEYQAKQEQKNAKSQMIGGVINGVSGAVTTLGNSFGNSYRPRLA